MPPRIDRETPLPRIEPVPIVAIPEGRSAAITRQFTGILSGLADAAGRRADEVAAAKGTQEGLIAGTEGTFEKRSQGRISGRAFNRAGATALRSRLDSNFKVKLLQSEAEHGSDLTAFESDMKDFIDGQVSAVSEFNPAVASLHSQSVAPSLAAVTNRVQKKQNAVFDDEAVANLIELTEAIQRENTVAARELMSENPETVQASTFILVENFIRMQEQHATLQSDGSRIVSESQAAAFEIRYVMDASENAFRGTIDNSSDVEHLMEHISQGTVEIPMLDTEGGELRVIDVDPFEVLPRERVEAVIRYGHTVANRRKRDRDTTAAAIVVDIEDSVRNAITRQTALGDAELPPDEVLSQALDDKQIERVKREFVKATREFTIREALIGDTPEGRQGLIQRLDEKMRTGTNFEFDQEILASAIKQNSIIELQLEKDPKNVVLQTDPFLQSVAQKLEASPEMFSLFIGQSLDAQRRQGVPESLRRVTTDAEATGLAGMLVETPDSLALVQTLGDIQARYGEHSQQVFNEMISRGGANPLIGILADLPPTHPSVGFFAELVKGNITEKTLSQGIPDTSSLQDVKEEVNTIVNEDFAPYLPPGNLGIRENYRNAIRLLTLANLNRGGSTDDAAQSAYDTLFGNQYELTRGTVRVPIAEFDKGVAFGLRSSDRLVSSVEDRIVPLNIFAADPRQDQEAVDEAYIESLKRDALIYTNSDETGVNIHDRDGVAVRDESGELISISWDQLRDLSSNSVADRSVGFFGQSPVISGGGF